MSDFRNRITSEIKTSLTEKEVEELKKMITFIDTTIGQAFKLSGDERANYLVTNLLNMKDYMSSRIVAEASISTLKNKVLSMYDDCVRREKEKEKPRLKKKETDLKQEAASAKDQVLP
jgi:2-phospho-L-lactate transferase/gluconeogenesis factor (CofD/UPF0052 family)